MKTNKQIVEELIVLRDKTPLIEDMLILDDAVNRLLKLDTETRKSECRIKELEEKDARKD